MSESFFLPWEVFSRRHAVGHAAGDAGHRVVHTWGLGRDALPEGGLVSSVADQLKYARYHLDGTAPGTPPLREATRIGMQQAQADAAPPFDAVGLPWLLVQTHGRTAITHGGNIAGVQLSSLLLMPESRLAVTCLSNAAAGRTLGTEVTNWCLENLAGLSPDDPPQTQHRPLDQLREYEGRYDCGVWGLNLVAEDGGLRASFYIDVPDAIAPPPMLLVFHTDDEVVPEGGTQLFGRFQRDSTGAVVRLLCQGRATRRMPR
jgi:hypothetical protein